MGHGHYGGQSEGGPREKRLLGLAIVLNIEGKFEIVQNGWESSTSGTIRKNDFDQKK